MLKFTPMVGPNHYPRNHDFDNFALTPDIEIMKIFVNVIGISVTLDEVSFH